MSADGNEIETITDLIELAFILMKSKERNKRNVGFKCVVRKVWVEWYVFLPPALLHFCSPTYW